MAHTYTTCLVRRQGQTAVAGALTAYQVGLGDVLDYRRRYGRQASPDTSPREYVTKQGTMGHAHIGRLLKDNGCWLQHRACMHAAQIDCAGTVPAMQPDHEMLLSVLCTFMYMQDTTR